MIGEAVGVGVIVKVTVSDAANSVPWVGLAVVGR
jgi:hypothetical protein